jgi:preprotein translocase subunit SecB
LLIDAINATIDFRTSAFDTDDVADLTEYAAVTFAWPLFRELISAAVTTATKSPSVVPTANW